MFLNDLKMQEEQMMVNDNSRKWSKYLTAITACGGAFVAGTIVGWSSPAASMLIRDNGDVYGLNLTMEQFSWIVSIMTLGAAFGCIPIGIFINKFGRKLTMILLTIPFTIGWFLVIFAQNLMVMMIGRALLGFAGGTFSIITPIYAGAVDPDTVGIHQWIITLGILFVYSVGIFVDIFVLSTICVIFPLICGGIFFFTSESPFFLISKGRTEAAITSIQSLRGKKYDYQFELADLQLADEEAKINPTSPWKAFQIPETRNTLIIALILIIFQQMSGFYAVTFYAYYIFRLAYTEIDAVIATIIIALIQVVATLSSTIIIDKFERRQLLLISETLIVLCTFFLGVYFYLLKINLNVLYLEWIPISAVSILIGGYAIGVGSIPWIMINELCTNDIKGFAVIFAGTFHWFLTFIVTKTFANLISSIGINETFWVYSFISIFGAIFVFWFVPEIKDKPLIQNMHVSNEEDDIQKDTSNDEDDIQKDVSHEVEDHSL